MSAVRQMNPVSQEIEHFMGLVIKELRGHVIERPISVKEAAEFLQISQRTLYTWMKNGTIPAKLIHFKGSRPYFFPSELRDEIKRS